MTPTPLYLDAHNIDVQAGELSLLESISFSLADGHGLILRGPNGVGKTSLLRIIAGFSKPSRGEVHFGTRSAATIYDIKTNTHFLGHLNGLKSSQTVIENLKFFSDFLGGDRKSLTATIQQLKLSALQHLPVNVLSAGQKRRAAFARLILSERKIWLLDEPTAALDQPTSALIETLCRAHIEKGGILIAASHLPFLENEKSTISTLDLSAHIPTQKWKGAL